MGKKDRELGKDKRRPLKKEGEKQYIRSGV